MEDAVPAEVPTCHTHPATEAIARCTQCVQWICPACHEVDPSGFARCPDCRAESSEREDAGPLGLGYVPFEAPEEVEPGALRRLLLTLRLVLLSPSAFYPRLAASAAVFRPVLFGYACILIGMVASLLWFLVLELPGREVVDKTAIDAGIEPEQLLFGILVLTPVLAALQLAVETLLYHVVARVAGGRGIMIKSIQLQGYSSGAHLLKIVPYIGGLLYWMARVYSQLTGTRVIHGLSTARAALAVLVPLIAGLFFRFGGMI